MSSPASFAKHPIHPMLVPFPVALWIFSLLCDCVTAGGYGGDLAPRMAYVTMAAGLIGAGFAAMPGLLDYLSIERGGRAWTVATTHLALNVIVVGLYVANLWLRTMDYTGMGLLLALSGLGVTLLGVSGWFGGELVYVLGMGVEEAAREAETPDQKRLAG